MSKEELQLVLEPLGCWDSFLSNVDIGVGVVDLDWLLTMESISSILMYAFNWWDTPEGCDYWAGIYIRLEAREGL